LLMDFNQRMVLLTKMRGQEQQLLEKYSQLESTRSALEAELDFANSDEAVEKWAREEGRMIQEGDIPIVLMPLSAPAPTSIPTPSTIIDEISRWEIWRELFFGN